MTSSQSASRLTPRRGSRAGTLRRAALTVAALAGLTLGCGIDDRPYTPPDGGAQDTSVAEPGRAPLLTPQQQELAQAGDAALPELEPQLNDPNPAVSEPAADVLESINTPAADDRLVSYALDHASDPGSPATPGPGAVRLQRIGPRIIPALDRAFSSSVDPKKRRAILRMVWLIGDSSGRPIAEKAIAQDDRILRGAGAELLGVLGGDGVFERLAGLVRSGDPELIHGAIEGMWRLGDERGVRELVAVLERPDMTYTPEKGAVVRVPGRYTLHQAAADAIDELTDESYYGDVGRIRVWIARNQRQ